MPIIRLEQLQQFTAINLLLDPGAIGGPVIVPSCAQIVLQWGLDGGKTGHNVLYGRYAGPFAGTVTQANGIMTALTSGAAWTSLATLLGTATSLSAVTIRNVAAANQPIISSTNPAVPGTGTGSVLPNEMAVCVTIRTAAAGRSGRGRLYVPGFLVSTVAAGNVISPATVTSLQAWANTIVGALNTQGYVMALGLPARAAYTGSTGTQHPARAATSETVTSLLVRDNHWDSQRRRGLK